MSATEAFFASRSMQALEVLAFGPATATQVANELQVHQRTARRLLNRMVLDGWLTRRDGPRPTYTPTLRIVALAAQLAARTPLVRHATEVAADLQASTGDAVHLAVPSYRSALRLVRVTGEACGAPALRAELERSRERGYATEDGEYRRGVRALALPVRAGDSRGDDSCIPLKGLSR